MLASTIVRAAGRVTENPQPNPKEAFVSKVKRIVGKRAAKAAVRHSAHGVNAKARRSPLRSSGLLGAGAIVGAVAGWLAKERVG
jgi:F0F1-type ATP synthase assembly protein I